MTAAQAELDFIQAHVRNGDPVTSIKAAESVVSVAASQCAAILGELSTAGRPLAAEQISDRLGLTTHATGKRLPDLESDGLIRKSDQQHKNRSGRWAVKWVAS